MQIPANITNPFRQTGETWLVEFHVPYKAVEQITDGFEDLPFNISAFEDDPAYKAIETVPETRFKVSLYSESQPDDAIIKHRLMVLSAVCDIDMPKYEVSLLPSHDWVSEVQKNFTPIHVGKYFIHCSDYDGVFPNNALPLQIDAGAAFGTGEHETTSGCMEVLGRLAKRYRFSNMIDMGCGTGILSIAMAETWKQHVLAADIDPNAVQITKRNADINHVSQWVHAVQSNGYLAREVEKYAPYDLIVANILAEPLVKFAKNLRKHLKADGIAVLSGLLIAQENNVLAAHRMQGLKLIHRHRKDGWSVLVLKG